MAQAVKRRVQRGRTVSAMKLATRLPGERSLRQEDADRIAAIRGQLIEVGDRWRAAHPFLARHQDVIGLALFLVSTIGVLVDAAMYIEGTLPWWLCIPLTAFWLSILHEIEHDLIHSMYFRTNELVHNAMMFGVWFLRRARSTPGRDGGCTCTITGCRGPSPIWRSARSATASPGTAAG
jgi:hypothetical protein